MTMRASWGRWRRDNENCNAYRDMTMAMTTTMIILTIRKYRICRQRLWWIQCVHAHDNKYDDRETMIPLRTWWWRRRRWWQCVHDNDDDDDEDEDNDSYCSWNLIMITARATTRTILRMITCWWCWRQQECGLQCTHADECAHDDDRDDSDDEYED